MSSIFSNTVFNELRLEGYLCDAVIRVDNIEFNVHRIVLCNSSSYFRNLFCRKPSASKQQQVFSFSQVSPNIMSLLVEYAYTSSVVVTEENVLELLAAADRFAVKGIMKACCNFLEQHLGFKNCIDISMLADFYKCPELRRKAYSYILQHFEEVAGFSVKFLQLSVQQLADLIEKDELNVRQESTVFEAVLRWIDYAPVERQGQMAMLLSKVRLLLMSSQYLVDTVRVNALVRKSPLCKTMVIKAMKTLHESNMERPLTRTRLPSAVLLAVGGWENDYPTNRVDLYDVRADRWVRVNNSREQYRESHSCVYLNGSVYFIGGFDGVKHLRSVQKLDLVTQTCQEVGLMHKPRSLAAAVPLNGCIYAMGGIDGHSKLNIAERYQPDTSQWTLIAPMHKHRSNASTTTLYGKVYICGGFNGDEPLSTAEYYNPHTNQWTLIAHIENGCNAAQAVAYQDKIYVVGGFINGSYTSRVVAFDPLSNQWTTVTPMINRRCCFGMAVLEDQLYVAGGLDTDGTTCKVERYDEKTNMWHMVRDMEMPRSCFSLCVVERDTYAAAYLL